MLFDQNVPGWYSEWREEDAWRKDQQFMLHSFINILHFLIFVDKSWFKVTNLFIYLSIYVYFKSGLPRKKCYESSKLTKNLLDSSA